MYASRFSENLSFGYFLEFWCQNFLEFCHFFDFLLSFSYFFEFITEQNIFSLNKKSFLASSVDIFSEKLSFESRKWLSFEKFWLSFGKA